MHVLELRDVFIETLKSCKDKEAFKTALRAELAKHKVKNLISVRPEDVQHFYQFMKSF